MLSTEWNTCLQVCSVSPGLPASRHSAVCLLIMALQVWEWSPQMQMVNQLNTWKKQWSAGVLGWPLSEPHSPSMTQFWKKRPTGALCCIGHHQFTQKPIHSCPGIFPMNLCPCFLRCVFRNTHLVQTENTRRPVAMLRCYPRVKGKISHPLQCYVHIASETSPSHQSWNAAAEICWYKMFITEVRLW